MCIRDRLLPAGYIVKPFKKKDIIATVEIASFKINQPEVSHLRTLDEINHSLTDSVTPKEYQILLDLAKGKTNDELCEIHFVSLNTIKTHLKRMYQKLGVSSRSNAILKVLK